MTQLRLLRQARASPRRRRVLRVIGGVQHRLREGGQIHGHRASWEGDLARLPGALSLHVHTCLLRHTELASSRHLSLCRVRGASALPGRPSGCRHTHGQARPSKHILAAVPRMVPLDMRASTCNSSPHHGSPLLRDIISVGGELHEEVDEVTMPIVGAHLQHRHERECAEAVCRKARPCVHLHV